MTLLHARLSLCIALVTTTTFATDSTRQLLRGGNEPRNLIVNGADAPDGRYPYAASLQVYGIGHICGASLIAPDIVLTAAHCGQVFKGITNVALNISVNYKYPDAESFGIVEHITHPLYKRLDGNRNDNDFMLIKLNGLSSHQPVRLNADDTLPSNGLPVRLVGWGNTKGMDGRSEPDVLQHVFVTTISNAQCRGTSSKYRKFVTPDSLCTAGSNKGFCSFDSGGPLVMAGASNNPIDDLLVGLVSWRAGDDCAETKYPSVYSRISARYPWIQSEVCRLSKSPPASFGCYDGQDTGNTRTSHIFPRCSVCGKGNMVTKPNVLPTWNSVHTCGSLESYGKAGAIPTDYCALYPSIIKTACGCSPAV